MANLVVKMTKVVNRLYVFFFCGFVSYINNVPVAGV